MAIQLKGLDKLQKKLADLENINVSDIIKESAKRAEEDIRKSAGGFSDKAYKCVARCDVREDKNYCYVDVGLANDKYPFEQWKSLYFQNYGFYDYGLNFRGQIYVDNHKLWFNQAVDSFKKAESKAIKEQLKSKVHKAWNG